jgi:hypothetical protein
MMQNLSGQLMCLFVVHCIYRSDYVHVWDEQKQCYEKQMTENFGDVSVDRGAG